MKPVILTLYAMLLLSSITISAAQSTSAPLPASPKAILLALKDANGLNPQPSVPWHLQLSWNQYDTDGDNIHSETIEEFYSGPKRFRIVFAGDSFNETQVAHASGLFLSGSADWPPIPALEALEFVATPLRRLDDEPKDLRLESTTQQFGSVPLSCIKALRSGVIEIGPPSYCYTPGQPQLRFSRAPALDAIFYNKLVRFQDRFVAKQISASVGAKPILQIRVIKLEDLGNPDDALFLPEAGQLPITGRMKIPSSLLVIEKRGELEPEAGHQGTATVYFVVGKDGRVIDAQAVSGPDDIQKIALRAMRQYRFRPFLILDQSIEVEGQMEFSVN